MKAKTHALDICDSVLNEVHILDAWVNLVEPLCMQQVVLESKQEEMQFILDQQDPTYHPDDSSEASDDIIPGTPEAVTVELREPPSKKPNAVPDPEIVSTRQAKMAEAVTVTVEETVEKTAPKRKPRVVTIPLAETAPKGKRSHHRRSLCRREVFYLKRHLKSHFKKDGLLEHKINKVYSVAVFQNRRRGPA